MNKCLLAVALVSSSFPLAAAECDVAELWNTLSLAEESVAECHLRLSSSDADRATADACIDAKFAWTRHAAVFKVCLQDLKDTAGLLGDDVDEFLERGKLMNDMQRINNEFIKKRMAALER